MSAFFFLICSAQHKCAMWELSSEAHSLQAHNTVCQRAASLMIAQLRLEVYGIRCTLLLDASCSQRWMLSLLSIQVLGEHSGNTASLAVLA